jgi:nitrile hydratase subunit beta
VRYRIGDRVSTTKKRSSGHTRLPAYLQQKPGTVVRWIGSFPLPDENAVNPKAARSSDLYTVAFRASDIFEGGPANDRIYADLFDDYLRPLG